MILKWTETMVQDLIRYRQTIALFYSRATKVKAKMLLNIEHVIFINLYVSIKSKSIPLMLLFNFLKFKYPLRDFSIPCIVERTRNRNAQFKYKDIHTTLKKNVTLWLTEGKTKICFTQIHKNKSKSYLQPTSRNMWSTEYYSTNELCLIRLGFFFDFWFYFAGGTRLVSINSLYKETGWETLQARQENHKKIYFYKMVNGLVFIISCGGFVQFEFLSNNK
jgi:hypothetical protein